MMQSEILLDPPASGAVLQAESLFGLHKTTLLDFPGEVAATLFIPGCNLRCPYCHNPEMVNTSPQVAGLYTWQAVREFILARRKLIGGICITGGEPLLFPALGELIEFIHRAGLMVKLDTNGTFPGRLQKLKVDYIAMDIKTAPEKYPQLGPGRNLPQRISASLEWIRQSGISCEFRTTVVPGLVGREDIRIIAGLIAGAPRYVLSQFRPGVTLDPLYASKLPYPICVLEELQQVALDAGVNCHIRAGYSTRG